jgi:RecG-like helicase
MGIRERFVALGQSRSDAEADELRGRHAEDQTPQDVTLLSACSPGDVVSVMGTIRSVTIRPAGRAPGTDIEIFDGSGSVNVVWMGRRRMAGIQTGRGIVVHGRMTCTTDNPTIYNPRYELAPLPL